MMLKYQNPNSETLFPCQSCQICFKQHYFYTFFSPQKSNSKMKIKVNNAFSRQLSNLHHNANWDSILLHKISNQYCHTTVFFNFST
jgi:hypothetical protein